MYAAGVGGGGGRARKPSHPPTFAGGAAHRHPPTPTHTSGEGSSAEKQKACLVPEVWAGATAGTTLSAGVREMLAEALAESTSKGYNGYLRRYHRFCRARGWTSFPAKPAQIAEWFVTITNNPDMERPGETLKSATSALGSQHLMLAGGNPALEKLVKLVKQGVTRKRTKRGRRGKELLDLEAVRSLLERLGPNDGMPYMELCMKAVALVALCGIGRAADLTRCLFKDVTFEEGDRGATIELLGPKQDRKMEGATLRLQRATEEAVCPVTG